MVVVRIRVAAYAVVLDADGRLLLSHWNGPAGRSGWTMPGGGLELGEHPAETVVREVREETGYDVEAGDLLGIDSIVIRPERHDDRAHGPVQGLRIVYRARVVGGALRAEADGSTDDAAWFAPDEVDRLDRVELVDAARRFAGLLPPS